MDYVSSIIESLQKLKMVNNMISSAHNANIDVEVATPKIPTTFYTDHEVEIC